MSELSLKDLNERTKLDTPGLIACAEEHYHEIIKRVALETDKNPAIRIILLAGPSGSGKTTSANLISDAIKASGRESMVISLDDFYRDSFDPEYPRLESGERDFESLDALNVPDLQKMLMRVSLGEDFVIPKYDFKLGKRVEERRHSPMPDGVVIIEGLHALNPRVFSLLPKERLYRIFISVSTNINDGDERILSGRKIRFTRRMVRDSIYRNADARRTLSMWKSVLRGEDIYLYPHRDNADISFNTFHEFELGVMRTFVEKLISEELAGESDYANTVRAAILTVEPINLSLVPETSLIREFVPGGIYEELY